MKAVPKVSGIYGLQNTFSGKWYVGKSKHIHKRNVNEKWQLSHPNRKAWNTQLQEDFRRYGFEGFVFHVLEICDECVLDQKEREWIDRLDSYRNGYNYTRGGSKNDGLIVTDITREKMRSASAKRWARPEERAKISIANLNPSAETRMKMRQSHLGKKQPPEQILKRVKHAYKPIQCVESGEIFESIRQAAQTYRIDPSSISSVAKGSQIRHTAGGFHWRYILDTKTEENTNETV